MQSVCLFVSGVMVFIVASCSSPTPSRPSPPVPDISGAWVGEVTLTQFDGGECVENDNVVVAGTPTSVGRFNRSSSFMLQRP